MQGLTVLNLGSGSGGTVTEAFEDKFIDGISCLYGLQQFTLRYDCTNRILQALSDVCRKSLLLLDIERSAKVDDGGLDFILRFKLLRSLDIFHTSLSVESKAEILRSLRELELLPRGDFLCEALDHLQETDPDFVSSNKLKLKGFWASEEYFFHSSDQMSVVGQTCPDIETMLFMFNNHESRFSDLTCFNRLKELDVWGGDFYTDEFYAALEVLGPQLSKLNLVHVEEIDLRAVKIMSLACTNLKTIGFYNCGFREPTGSETEQEGFQAVDRHTRREEEMMVMTLCWLDLEKINITSEIGPKLLTILISMGLNLTHISLGMHTAISDHVLAAVLKVNSLQRLQQFKCAQSVSLTMKSVSLLMEQCQALTACLDIDYWEGVTDAEREKLKFYIKVNNFDLQLSEEVAEPANSDLIETMISD